MTVSPSQDLLGLGNNNWKRQKLLSAANQVPPNRVNDGKEIPRHQSLNQPKQFFFTSSQENSQHKAER